MVKPRRTSTESRDAILRAARDEFAARGFAASRVDQLALRARVNKALIYYYFGSKLGLYREVLRDAMTGFIARLQVVASSSDSPETKVARWVEELAAHLVENPSLPPVLLREVADGGVHLDADALRHMTSIVPMIQRIIAEGHRQGVFGDADPIAIHFMLLGSLVLVTANAPIRRRVRELGLAQPPLDIEPFVRHLQDVTLRSLRKDSNHADTTP
jgi:TetR/AcrR family transcriptional regulator